MTDLHPMDGGKFVIGEPTDGLRCYGVKSDLADWFIHEAWDLLEPAAARNGLYTQESLWAALKQGLMQLWLGEVNDEIAMALVTEIADYPARRQCTIVMAGGSHLDQFMPFLATLEAWARYSGCQRIRIEGRSGWQRKLAPSGYQSAGVILVRNLNDG